MCGIAGALALKGAVIEREAVIRMAHRLLHRGPEVIGIFDKHPIMIAHDRLSIIDLEGGLQPLDNEDKSIRLICNGEIFNHIELREELYRKGHHFRTGSDCEAIIHMYEEYGIEPALNGLNGQWAFALWDEKKRNLILGRDRVGVRPLFYTVANGVLYYASEIKALLGCPGVNPRLAIRSLEQVLTFWSALPGNTMFEGIYEIPAGHYVTINADEGKPRLSRYWQLEFPAFDGKPQKTATSPANWLAGLRELLEDATKLRLLRADVPVGAYLSGGLDSSVITALAKQYAVGTLETFSVAFTEEGYDERQYQELMANHLGTNHHMRECTLGDIGKALPEVIYHAEVPMLRTAPIPLFLLSQEVRQSGMKVVLTGEGSDEFLLGYDIFREARIRRFWARHPDWAGARGLMGRVHKYLENSAQNDFFAIGMEQTSDPLYSHRPRWRNSDKLKRFLSAEAKAQLGDYNSLDVLVGTLPEQFPHWHYLAQAQHLEINTFLSTYLLSTQGDRVAMAHSVEGRFPFLDYRVVQYCNSMPPEMKLYGLNEKWILKQMARGLVPDAIVQREKKPFRAPIKKVFDSPEALEYVQTLLAPQKIAETGVFNAKMVQKLWEKTQKSEWLGEVDQMTLMAVVTFQLWHATFLESSTRLDQQYVENVEIREVA